LKDEIEKKNKKLTKGPRTKITNQKSEDKYPNTCNQGDHPEILNGQCESQGRREKKLYRRHSVKNQPTRVTSRR